jgi:hypothetical protein
VFLAILLPRNPITRSDREPPFPSVQTQRGDGVSPRVEDARPALTPEQMVASKVNRFARDRLRITRAMAKRVNMELPPEVEQFFDAVASGRWEELNERFETLKQLRDSAGGEKLRSLWGPLLETLLIAECAHAWPAQKLLDYGQATLGSLPPGMVYIGGTDPGRGIPTLLNQTSEGDTHIVITQNGLADATYLEYVRFQYGDQLTLPSEEDCKNIFNEYVVDAQKRLEHDQQFPDEPKQIRPGEDIQFQDDAGLDSGTGTNRAIQVSGPVAVMGINERLLQAIMDKNPGLSFALEESIPLPSTYANAVPLGPIMQLRTSPAQESFTEQSAAQAVDYWRSAVQQLSPDPDAGPGSDVSKTYSHMAWSQANLLADHNYDLQAEQTYRLALELEPSNKEAVDSLAALLFNTGRSDEAQQLVESFQRTHPSVPAPPVPVFTLKAGQPPK